MALQNSRKRTCIDQEICKVTEKIKILEWFESVLYWCLFIYFKFRKGQLFLIKCGLVHVPSLMLHKVFIHDNLTVPPFVQNGENLLLAFVIQNVTVW